MRPDESLSLTSSSPLMLFKKKRNWNAPLRNKNRLHLLADQLLPPRSKPQRLIYLVISHHLLSGQALPILLPLDRHQPRQRHQRNLRSRQTRCWAWTFLEVHPRLLLVNRLVPRPRRQQRRDHLDPILSSLFCLSTPLPLELRIILNMNGKPRSAGCNHRPFNLLLMVGASVGWMMRSAA